MIFWKKKNSNSSAITAQIGCYTAFFAANEAEIPLMEEHYIQTPQKIFVFKSVWTQFFVTLCTAELLRKIGVLKMNILNIEQSLPQETKDAAKDTPIESHSVL